MRTSSSGRRLHGGRSCVRPSREGGCPHAFGRRWPRADRAVAPTTGWGGGSPTTRTWGACSWCPYCKAPTASWPRAATATTSVVAGPGPGTRSRSTPGASQAINVRHGPVQGVVPSEKGTARPVADVRTSGDHGRGAPNRGSTYYGAPGAPERLSALRAVRASSERPAVSRSRGHFVRPGCRPPRPGPLLRDGCAMRWRGRRDRGVARRRRPR